MRPHHARGRPPRGRVNPAVVACSPDRSPAAALPARPLAVGPRVVAVWHRWCSGRRLILQWGLAAPWAAARPRVVCAASFARRVDSLSGQASPPPTGAAARPCHRLRAPQPGAATVHGCRSQALPPSTGAAARPRHRPRVPQPGPASKPGHALRSLRCPSRRRCLWFWCTRAPKPMGAQTGSGERNIAPAWCSSSWNGASLKQKPPTHAHNRRKLAYLGVLGRIIFHGVPQQLMHGRFFFQSGPACGHRCQQLLPDRGCRGRRLYVDLPC